MSKKILSLLLILAMTCLQLTACASTASTFSDVEGHWAQATIEELAGKGIINGKDNNTYDPEGSVTRAEFMKLLIATEEAELPAIADGELSDVAEDAWYNPYVYAGLDRNLFVLSELENNGFMPDSPADRETVALWAVRLLGLESETTVTTFADDSDIANKNAVAAAYENGIITGDAGTNTFRSNDTLTRAEAAVIIKRVMDKADETPAASSGEAATEGGMYTDKNGDTVIIPKQFTVSEKEDEQTISTGLVIIGPDGSEFVWVPTAKTTFARNDFGSRGFYDETDSEEYKSMAASVEKYGGFYMGRYEASYVSGSDTSDYIPASKKADSESIWVHIPPQDMIPTCNNLYADNESVVSFLPWGINWDTTVQWLIDSGCKTENEVVSDSSSWGNYSNNTFAEQRDYGATGQWEETKANNIYDLAGNFWEWTQERSSGDGYAARAGGYSIMGGPCPGYNYPVVFRSGLPGNDHHPNITFRVALYLK